MNRKGELALIEGLIIVGLIAVVLWLGWMLIHKPSENSIFQADSKATISEPSIHPFINFPCGILFSIKGQNEPIASKTKH